MLQPGRNYSATDSYRYGFNGKERSSEVASDNYDFGARIYDGRIGRWLSVDNLMKKYPSLSPFIFTNDNPILFIDYDGNDWTQTITKDKDGNLTLNLKLTAALVAGGTSMSKDEIQMFADLAAAQIKEVYSVSYMTTVTDGIATMESNLDNWPGQAVPIKKDIKVTFKVDVDIRIVNSEYDVKSNEHTLSVVPDQFLDEGTQGEVDQIGGKKIIISESAATKTVFLKDKRTVAHEIGHTLGLRHTDVKFQNFLKKIFKDQDKNYINNDERRKKNIMNQTLDNSARELTVRQMEEVRKNLSKEKINKEPEYPEN